MLGKLKPPLISHLVDGHSRRNHAPPIMFIQEDAEGVNFIDCNVLIVRVVVAQNGLKRMLVDNDSFVNILFKDKFDKMILDHELTLIATSLYGFTTDSIILRGMITLTVEMGESPQTTLNFMEFSIVDNKSAYHKVLKRLA